MRAGRGWRRRRGRSGGWWWRAAQWRARRWWRERRGRNWVRRRRGRRTWPSEAAGWAEVGPGALAREEAGLEAMDLVETVTAERAAEEKGSVGRVTAAQRLVAMGLGETAKAAVDWMAAVDWKAAPEEMGVAFQAVPEEG